jgi:hypothetical protein
MLTAKFFDSAEVHILYECLRKEVKETLRCLCHPLDPQRP